MVSYALPIVNVPSGTDIRTYGGYPAGTSDFCIRTQGLPAHTAAALTAKPPIYGLISRMPSPKASVSHAPSHRSLRPEGQENRTMTDPESFYDLCRTSDARFTVHHTFGCGTHPEHTLSKNKGENRK